MKDGDVYEGDWVDDKRTGKGIYKFKSGNVYEGDFVDGKITGKGIYKFKSGNVYEGDFVDDKQEKEFTSLKAEMFMGVIC